MSVDLTILEEREANVLLRDKQHAQALREAITQLNELLRISGPGLVVTLVADGERVVGPFDVVVTKGF